MTAALFEFDEAKQAKVKADRERMHWNLLVDAKKEPIKVREALLGSIFDEVMSSLIFIDASMREGTPTAKYQMALIKLIGTQLVTLIPTIELKQSYEEHLEYIDTLKSYFYNIDKEVFRVVHSLHTVNEPNSLSVQGLKTFVDSISDNDIESNRITILLGSDTSAELLNSKEFVEVFEPYTDQELLLKGKLGRLYKDEKNFIPVLTDGMRLDKFKCLRPDGIYICNGFDANLRVRHNHTWDSLIFDINGLLKGITEYVYRAD